MIEGRTWRCFASPATDPGFVPQNARDSADIRKVVSRRRDLESSCVPPRELDRAGPGLRVKSMLRQQRALQHREELLAHRVAEAGAGRAYRQPHARFATAQAASLKTRPGSGGPEVPSSPVRV
jgi:hypothetical protein